MTKEEMVKEIKFRLSNIGEAIGMIALEYIEKLETENEELKSNWHDLRKDPTDLPKGEEYSFNGVHRKILIQDRWGNIYTGNYYPKSKHHKEDCFAVEFLDMGVQGNTFCKVQQIIKWKEFPKIKDE